VLAALALSAYPWDFLWRARANCTRQLERYRRRPWVQPPVCIQTVSVPL